MHPIASGSSAASRIATDEGQSFYDLKPPHKSVVAFVNNPASEIPERELVQSLQPLKLDLAPEPMVTTAIQKRKVAELNPKTSNADLAEVSQTHEHVQYDCSSEPVSADEATVPGSVSANSPEPGSADEARVPEGSFISGNTLTSLNRPSTDDSGTDSSTYDSESDASAYDSDSSDSKASTDESDTESACQTVLTAGVFGAAANNDASVPLQGVALENSQSGKIDAKTADIFHCDGNYLKLKKVIKFGRDVYDARFSPTSKNLVIHGCDRNDDRVLGIWQQTADGNWSQNGKIREDTFRFEFNRSEDTFLSISHDGNVTVSQLNSDGIWEAAVVLAHRPSTNGEDIVPVRAGFSPRQDKIMTYDFWAGKIKVLPQDSNGQWNPLTQTGISHCRLPGPQQPPFNATDHYL
ncbi:hypothetical protein, partial [Endozoicomonas sp. ONNA2]|uniref:hypothetical protein n=1 Tax=Endozoicomonas sp. ONNA2 TaxID=2828741 RepID=UPI002148ACCA